MLPCALQGTQLLTLNDISLQGAAGLGRQPKNAQLLEAMAQHRNAKLRTVPWLLGIIERYRQGCTASAHSKDDAVSCSQVQSIAQLLHWVLWTSLKR